MIGWIFQRRKDGALFKVVKVNRNAPYWRIQEIETGEMLSVTADGMKRRSRWTPVGIARSVANSP